MYYCIFSKDKAVTAWHETAPVCGPNEYCFLLSSAESDAEASAIAAEIGRKLDPTETREANIARIERFLGTLEFLDRRYDTEWAQSGFVDDFCGTDEDLLLAGLVGCAGVPERYAEFFVTHAAIKLAEYLRYEEYLADYVDPDSDSDFARACRRHLRQRAVAAQFAAI